MLICGIDENGLGPFLGPLIITAYESEEESSGGLEIKDSKVLFSRKKRDFVFIEEFFVKHQADKLTEDLSLKGLFCGSAFSDEIRRICPIGPELICFPDKVKIPVWIEAFCGVPRRESNIHMKENFYFAIICPKLLFSEIKVFGSKFSADAYFMSVLALKSRAQKIICGKSGFKKRYVREISEACEFIGLKVEDITVVKESNEESIYILIGQVGGEEKIKELMFVKDADKKFTQVATASILGKYLRELCMLALTKAIDSESKFPISGYGRKEKLKVVSDKISEEFRKIGVGNVQEIKKECIERNY